MFSLRSKLGMLAIACVLAPAAAACGGSDGEGGGTAPAASATVSVKEVPGYGEVLATAGGKLLFVLTSDPEGGSKCAADCIAQWPPLGDEKPTAGPGVDSGKLSTFTREDGAVQVLYNNHALYTTTGEELAGPGTKGLGGTWYFISPDGDPVESTEAGGY